MSYCNSWSKWPMIWHVGLVGVDQFHTDFGQSRRNKVEWSNQDIYTVTFVMRQLCGRVFDIWRFYFFLFFFWKQSICVHIYLVGWFKKKEFNWKMPVVVLATQNYCSVTPAASWLVGSVLTEAWYRIAHGKGDFSVVISWLWKTIPNHFFCPLFFFFF